MPYNFTLSNLHPSARLQMPLATWQAQAPSGQVSPTWGKTPVSPNEKTQPILNSDGLSLRLLCFNQNQKAQLGSPWWRLPQVPTSVSCRARCCAWPNKRSKNSPFAVKSKCHFIALDFKPLKPYKPQTKKWNFSPLFSRPQSPQSATDTPSARLNPVSSV